MLFNIILISKADIAARKPIKCDFLIQEADTEYEAIAKVTADLPDADSYEYHASIAPNDPPRFRVTLSWEDGVEMNHWTVQNRAHPSGVVFAGDPLNLSDPIGREELMRQIRDEIDHA